MKAAYYEKNGSARDVLHVGDVATPEPGLGEVRVRLAASGVNPSDVKSRQGSTRKITWPRLIPQSDGAGTIDAVGDGVPALRIGERVWVWNGQWKRAFGTAAEYIVLPAAAAAPLPPGVSFEEGACLGIPAMTAYHAVHLAEVTKDSTIFVSGGAGSVSQYVIQFAKMAGAQAITTVSSAEKAAIAREAGADHTIDYKREDVGARVMELTGKRGADAIIEMDLTANAKLIPAVLRPKGSVIVYGTGGNADLPAHFCLTQSIRIPACIASSEICSATPTYKLDDIAAAHEAVERGTIGNVIVTM